MVGKPKRLCFTFVVAVTAANTLLAQGTPESALHQPLDLSLPKGTLTPPHIPPLHLGPAHNANPLKNNLRCKFSKSLMLVPLGEGKLYIVGQGNIITYKMTPPDTCEESAVSKIAQALGG